MDHRQGFVVSFHHVEFPVDVCVEAFTAEDDSQEFTFDVGVPLLGLCEDFAGRCCWSSVLEEGCADSDL